jgi:phosphatidate phosphatase PAH1
MTRKYLDDLQLPPGPVLLSYKGFFDAFTSEVVTKDAKLMKFEHLTSIQ